MGALSRLIAKELSSAFGFTKKVKDIKTEPALGIVDNPKYNPAFKEKPDEKLTPFDEMSDVELGYSDEELGFDDYSLIDDDVLDDLDEIDDQARLFEDANNDPWQYVDQDGDDLEFNDPRNPDLGAEMMRQIGEEAEPLSSRIEKAEQENTIATFYSPLMSALDEAPISDKGTMGKNIMAFIRKRSPKMSEGELNYTGDFLDPNRKYTREEAKDLAYQKGLTVKAVINQGRNYQGLQRQRLSYKDYMDMDESYVEILLEGNKNTYRGKDIRVQGSHHDSNTLAHARLSLHVDLKEYNDAIYKHRSDFAEDNLENGFLLIEELQSDMLQKVDQRGQSPTKDRLPINKDKDYLRNLLQSIFIHAKNNNINSIVLPPVKKLREKRVRDLRTTSKDAGQKMFDMTYNKAFRKALKSLQDEYPKGTIKTREKKLKFMDGPSKDTISDREFYMAIHGIEDPDVLRRLNLRDGADDYFYAQHREEYAQQAFDNYAVLDEDISTETGLEIDISNLLIGNTVPRFNEGGLVKKPGLMQRSS